jgi:hypothetical protein
MSKKATAVTDVSLATAIKNGVTIVKTEENKLFLWVEIAHAVIHGDFTQVAVIKAVKAKTGVTLDKSDFSKAVTVAKECERNARFLNKLESGKFRHLNDAYATVLGKTTPNKTNAVRFSDKQIKKAVRAYNNARNAKHFMELLGK